MALTRLGPNQLINLATNTTGTLGVANGGTGLTSGTTDQLLKFTGSTTLASSAIATGKVLQVQYDNKASTGSTSNLASSGNYADALSVNITPSASSSTIAITAMINTGASSVSNGSCILRCLRDSTQIADATGVGSLGSEYGIVTSNALSVLDTPNTTSQITYKMQGKSDDGTVMVFNVGSNVGALTAFEIEG